MKNENSKSGVKTSRQAEKKTALFVIQKNKPKLFRCLLSSEISLFTFRFAVSFFLGK